MKFSVIMCHDDALTIAPKGYFDPIGKFDEEQRRIEIGLSQKGERSCKWILDSEGKYYPLEWQGRVEPSLTQKIGLKREREAYTYGEGRTITVGELKQELAKVADKDPDLPHQVELLKLLQNEDDQSTITPQMMQKYFGK